MALCGANGDLQELKRFFLFCFSGCIIIFKKIYIYIIANAVHNLIFTHLIYVKEVKFGSQMKCFAH